MGGSFNWQWGDVENSFVWAKLLENGDIAIGMFNFSDDVRSMYFTLPDLALPRSSGMKLELKDLWTGEVCYTEGDKFMTKVEGCDCRLYRAKLVKV